MGSSIAEAKMSSSWNALEKIEAFTAAVKRQLERLPAHGRVAAFAREPLSGDRLDKVIMAIWCVCHGGMQWRTVGHLTGIPFATIYACFARWTRLGVWTMLLDDLLGRWRMICGDMPEPSAVVMDSRSCRSAPTCGKRGIDGGKKVKGVKVHLVVDKHGIPLAVTVSAANVHDTVGILPALREVASKGFTGTALGDSSYAGKRLGAAAQAMGITVATKLCGRKGTFIPTEIRWVVERSFAWLSRYRRLNTIFERTDESLIAFVRIAFISILASRLDGIKTAEKLE